MQNKIYKTLAYLFNQFKQVVGDSNSLDEAIENKVHNSPEVLNSRGRYNTLGDRMNGFENIVSNTDISVNRVESMILEHKADPIHNVAPPIGVDVTDKRVFIGIQDKLNFDTLEFLLPSQSNKIIYNDNERMFVKAFMKSDYLATELHDVPFAEDNILYDKDNNSFIGGEVIPKSTGNLYELPLNRVYTVHNEEIDMCYVPNLCVCTADYISSVNIHPNNHFANIFKSQYNWVVDRSFVSFIINFDYQVPLSKIEVDFDFNSKIPKLLIEYSLNGTSWTSLYDGSENKLSHELQSQISIKYIRVSLDIYDNTGIDYEIIVNSIKLFAIEYFDKSNLIQLNTPILINENQDIKLRAKSTTDESPFFDSKYAIINRTDNEDTWATYLPKIYDILPRDFYDSRFLKYTENVLKNNIKINQNSPYIFDSKNMDDYVPINTEYAGAKGNVSISYGVGASDTDAWKPRNKTFIKIRINVNGQSTYVSLDTINEDIEVSVGGVALIITVFFIDTVTLKVHVRPKDTTQIITDNIEVFFKTPYRLDPDPDGGGRDYVSSSTHSSHAAAIEYIDGMPLVIGQITNTYACTIHDYYRFKFWFWGWEWRWQTWNSSFNGSESYTVAIVPQVNDKDSYANAYSSTVNGGYREAKYSKNKCKLPVNIYVRSDGNASNLRSKIGSDMKNLTHYDTEDAFTYEKDFTTKLFIGDSKIVRITPTQEVTEKDNIEYLVSHDGYNFYVYDNEKALWSQDFNKGMTIDNVIQLNNSHFDLLNKTEWLYIKIRIKSPDARVSRISVEFDKDRFTLINENEILSKGMEVRALENINPSTMRDFLINDFPMLIIGSKVKSHYPMFKYNLSGYSVVDYNDAQWESVNSSKVKEISLNNGVLFKNLTSEDLLMKVDKYSMNDQTVVIDTIDTVKDEVEEIKDLQEKASNDFNLRANVIEQNVQLMYEEIKKGNVPEELPDFVLPNLREVDLPVLAPNETYKTDGAKEFRGIQVWEEKTSFLEYGEKLIFDTINKDRYESSLVEIEDDGASLDKNYDTSNSYQCPEDCTGASYTNVTTPMFDVSSTLRPINNLTLDRMISDNGSDAHSFVFTNDPWFGHFNWNWGGSKWIPTWENCQFDLPGEDTRWVDLIFDFRHFVYIKNINNLYVAGTKANITSPGYTQFSNQITTFSYSLDGKEYTECTKLTGPYVAANIIINKELRYLRIRLELPYSANHGKGYVSISGLNIYFCPPRYVYNQVAHISTVDPIDTSDWVDFKRILVDRFIDHDPAEMKFLLSDDPDNKLWRAWNGTSWSTTTSMSVASAMSIETLLSLGSNELNQLNKGVLYFAAIMRSTDPHKTPVLREVEFINSINSQKYYELVDPNTVGFKQIPSTEELIITNKTNGSKKLKIVLL